MQALSRVDLEWQSSLFESFMNMTKAADGDFDYIGQLAQAASDRESLDLIIEFLSRHPEGKKAFVEYPRLGKVDLQQLHQLPKNTLGYAFAEHMIKNGLTPLEGGAANNKYEFLGAHIAETHDIWHVVTGFDTNIIGEIQLEAFYVAQLYASRFWLALIAKNLLKATVFNIEVSAKYMDAITQGWMMAKQAKPLFGIQWNALWDASLPELRANLNIVPISFPFS